MKAAFLDGIGKITVRETAAPEIKPNSLLLRVKACGICGSDLRTYRHGNDRIKFPAIIGHEMTGVVEEVGEGAAGFSKGDKVAVGADIPCGKCHWCKKGITNNCERHMAIGYQMAGGFAEYCLIEPVVLENGPIFKIPKGLDFVSASLMEPLACCINGSERIGMRDGGNVLIIGAGPMGCLLSLLSKTQGAEKVILAEHSKGRLEMAKKAGAADAYILNSEEGLKERALEETSGFGADFIYVACPVPEMQENALELSAKRGAVNYFGGLPSTARKIAVSSNRLHYSEIMLTGSHGSTPAQNKKALDILSSGKIDARKIITKTIALEKIEEGLLSLERQDELKITVEPYRE